METNSKLSSATVNGDQEENRSFCQQTLDPKNSPKVRQKTPHDSKLICFEEAEYCVSAPVCQGAIGSFSKFLEKSRFPRFYTTLFRHTFPNPTQLNPLQPNPLKPDENVRNQECLVGISRFGSYDTFRYGPTGQPQISPGQRPGFRIKTPPQALKHNAVTDFYSGFHRLEFETSRRTPQLLF